jgi:hypothetical protein
MKFLSKNFWQMPNAPKIISNIIILILLIAGLIAICFSDNIWAIG